ncbi:MAG: hypothetical protein R2802_10675 [Flavobacteriaceae bacterium]
MKRIQQTSKSNIQKLVNQMCNYLMPTHQVRLEPIPLVFYLNT